MGHLGALWFSCWPLDTAGRASKARAKELIARKRISISVKSGKELVSEYVVGPFAGSSERSAAINVHVTASDAALRAGSIACWLHLENKRASQNSASVLDLHPHVILAGLGEGVGKAH